MSVHDVARASSAPVSVPTIATPAAAPAATEAAPPADSDAAVVATVARAAPAPLTYGKTGETNEGDAYLQLQKLVASYLTEQGLSTRVATGDGTDVDVNELSSEDAAALVADDGYWGAEATATRIADFALQMVGSDPTRAQQVREALQQGFDEAREVLGGTLPSVSEDTIAKTFEKFDEGVAKISGS